MLEESEYAVKKGLYETKLCSYFGLKYKNETSTAVLSFGFYSQRSGVKFKYVHNM